MEKIRDNKGITLIVLIITIIVILIIAGISISGAINGIDESSENRLIAEMEKVQHAVTQRYSKFELTKDASILVGTNVDLSSLTGVPNTINWKVFQVKTEENDLTLPERRYYRLSKSDLENLGLTGDYRNSSYVVNYYSGEVYDETEKQTASGRVLYKTAIENEASGLGDDIITDGLQVYYDAINNTGTGHSDTTTVWKDLSGNGNDAQITTTGSSLNWQSNCLATNKAESIKTPWTFSTSHTISVILEPLEFYNYNTIWENDKTPNDNESWFYSNGKWEARSNAINGYPGSYWSTLDKKISFDIVIDNENNECISYVNGDFSRKNGTINLNGGKLIFNGGIQNTFGKNNYYSMKVYNKALSASEVKHNYILDKARYGIEE